MPKFKKTNANGSYDSYPGLTIISKVNQHDFVEEIHRALSNLEFTCGFYAPLPSQSYHMTTCNLYTANSAPANNLQLLIENYSTFFQDLHAELVKDPLPFSTSVIDLLVTDSSIKLVLKAPKAIVNANKDMANKFNLRNKVPYEFHMTLGYSYRDVSRNEKKQIIAEIKYEFDNLFKSYGKELTMMPAKLTYFNRMGDYHDWDGSSYPFEIGPSLASLSSSTDVFFKPQAISSDSEEKTNKCCVIL